MRLLVVADLHYALPQYDWVLDVAPEFDVVIIAGDHLDTASMVDGRAQSVVVRKYISRIKNKTRLIICSGNHDLDTRDASGEKIVRWILAPRADGVPTDGDSLVIDDILFTICPWWDGPNVRAAITRQFAADAGKRTGQWFWVHHAPARDSPTSWDGQRSFGDVELKEWIAQYRPDVVFSGHVHQSPFVPEGSWVDKIDGTWVFNAGRQFGAPPSFIVLDTGRRMALWFSAYGNQMVRLEQPLRRPVDGFVQPPDWFSEAHRVAGRTPA